MSEPSDVELSLERLRALLAGQRPTEAAGLWLDLHPADQAELFNALADDEQSALLALLDVPATADLLEELEDDEALDAVEGLSNEKLADVLDEMAPDEAADLIGDLPAAQVSQVLAQMEDADEVLPLLGYPDETAGGLMTTWFIALRRQTTVDQAIQFLRQTEPDTKIPYYLYVVDREQHLTGVVGFRDLVVAKPDATIETIMNREVAHITAGADQEEAARLMSRYNLSSLPVVNEQHKLLGVITHDDIVDVLEEEATEDMYALANVSDADLEPESPIREQLKGRLPWVYVNMFTALFASWVVSHFETLIAEVAILAAFQSVVAGLGGNAASQNVAMLVRSMALGKVELRNFWAVLGRQVLVGVLQGVAVGLIAGAGVALWRGNLHLGLVLGLAMVGNMLIAGVMGTLVPWVLRGIGQDPAVASSVLVTAATDSFGFFLFLGLASLFITQLK